MNIALNGLMIIFLTDICRYSTGIQSWTSFIHLVHKTMLSLPAKIVHFYADDTILKNHWPFLVILDQAN